jgi:hypothetical protein
MLAFLQREHGVAADAGGIVTGVGALLLAADRRRER